MIRIDRLGLATTVQDRGRRGWAHLGVGRAGAADVVSHELANRLVGNELDAATLETSGGLRFTALASLLVALAGAPCDVHVEAGPPLGHGAPQSLPADAVVTIGASRDGLRTYLALRGGIAVAAVLGSRSRDTLGQVGPELAVGDVIPVGADPGSAVPADIAPQRPWPSEVRVQRGPRLDWFSDRAWATLTSQPYAVTPETDRVGARLRGIQPLTRRRHDELPSEGLVVGAVQVPPDGQPIVMLADHPVTGGYPVIAVVAEASLSTVAQARPGTQLRFTAVRTT